MFSGRCHVLDVHKTSFWDVLMVSWRRNFAECVVPVIQLRMKNKTIKIQWKNIICKIFANYLQNRCIIIIWKTPRDVFVTDECNVAQKVVMFWNSNEKLSLLWEIAMTLKTNVPKLLSTMSLLAWILQQVLTIYLISVKKSTGYYFHEILVRAYFIIL